jgi:hypothetical protein
VPRLESTSFGSVTIDGKEYDYDVLITVSGEIVRHDKTLSLEGHKVGREELEPLWGEKPEVIVIATGQYGAIPLDNGAIKQCQEQGIKVIAAKTPQALQRYNELKERKAAFIHTLC